MAGVAVALRGAEVGVRTGSVLRGNGALVTLDPGRPGVGVAGCASASPGNRSHQLASPATSPSRMSATLV